MSSVFDLLIVMAFDLSWTSYPPSPSTPPPPRVLESARSARSKLRGARPSMRAPSTTIWRCSFSSAMSLSSGQQTERKRNYLYELANIMFTHSSAYPLAGLCALLNNLIEIRRWAFSQQQQQQQHSINTTQKKKTAIRNNNRRWNDDIDNEQIQQQQQQQLWHNTIKTTKAKTPVTMITTATTTTKGTKEQKHICNTNSNNNKKYSKTNNGFKIEIFLQIQSKAKNKCYIFSDAFKLCYIHQRPFPQRVDSIGSWQTAMEVFLSLLSTF